MLNLFRTLRRVAGTLALLAGLSAAPALAQSCGNDGSGFAAWKQQFTQQAQSAGISARVLEASIGSVTYNPKVVSLDRNQKSFRLSLEDFMARRAPPSFVSKGKRIIRDNASLLNSIEQSYGVPKEVLVAIWGMETGFGSNSGDMSVMRSLATLAYDCRRSDFFTNELMAALAIVQRGDMSPDRMIGAWAGEIGQTQFLASNYLKFAVDADGNGRRDLIRSKADVLASTANFLRQHGWQPGAGYGEGETNFPVLKDWNRAQVYQRALALFASQLAS